MIVILWNTLKSSWSRANDWFRRYDQRRPVPKFLTPEAVGSYLQLRGRYTGDWGGGAGDSYTHPERFQYAMETGEFAGLPIDCDDYAIWAHQALLTVPDCHPQIYTLRDAGLVGSHVVCVYRTGLRYGVIDTNGHRALPNDYPTTLCSVFNDVYTSRGYNYVEAVPTRYPF